MNFVRLRSDSEAPGKKSLDHSLIIMSQSAAQLTLKSSKVGITVTQWQIRFKDCFKGKKETSVVVDVSIVSSLPMPE